MGEKIVPLHPHLPPPQENPTQYVHAMVDGVPVAFEIKERRDHTYKCQCGALIRMDSLVSVYEPQSE